MTPDIWPVDPPRTPPLRLRGRTFDAARPAVMAIINRTPDSFYATAGTREVNAALAALDAARPALRSRKRVAVLAPPLPVSVAPSTGVRGALTPCDRTGALSLRRSPRR